MVRAMKTISKSIPARELPSEWREEGSFAPDDRVTVTIDAEDPAVTALRERIERAVAQSEQGQSRELTDQDFEAIKRRGRQRRLKRM